MQAEVLPGLPNGVAEPLGIFYPATTWEGLKKKIALSRKTWRED